MGLFTEWDRYTAVHPDPRLRSLWHHKYMFSLYVKDVWADRETVDKAFKQFVKEAEEIGIDNFLTIHNL